MNILSLDTKEKLEAWGQEFLLVTEGITPSSVTGFNRAVILTDFICDFRNKQIKLVTAVYELNSEGNPIISNSLKPYEQLLVAHNGNLVDATGAVVDNPEEGVSYMGEFDFYMALTKNNAIQLWEVFETIIKNSRVINS
jgi:hypothetical protein